MITMPRNMAAMPSSWHDHGMAAMFFQPGITGHQHLSDEPEEETINALTLINVFSIFFSQLLEIVATLKVAMN